MYGTEGDTELGETAPPAWWGFLPGDEARIEPGDFSFKIWKTPLYFSNLGQDWLPGKSWYSNLFLPYCVYLTPEGVYYTSGVLTLWSGPWVYDPQIPKNFSAGASALKSAPKDTAAWVAWFEDHPHLRLTTEPDEWKNRSGGASGIEFGVEVNPNSPDNKLHTGVAGPSVPFGPSAPRSSSFVFGKGKKNRVIVLEHEAETMIIITESPPNQFDQFYDQVDKEVLASMYLGMKPSQ